MTPLSCDLKNSFTLRLSRCAAMVLAAGGCVGFSAQPPVASDAPQQVGSPAPEQQRTLFIREYRVLGAKELPKIVVEEAVYRYLGPGRTMDDIQDAVAALENAYRDKGYIAQVSASEPSNAGIVNLQVVIGRIGSLHVKDARYFRPSVIRKQAQSLAEGKVINFNDVKRDIISLNQHPDRRVRPGLKPDTVPGAEPGMWDAELLVKDKSPFHGSVELNNRNSANTTELRLNGSFSYANLWQRGHSIGASYQISPQDPSEVKVLSAYYVARFQGVDDFSLMFTGTKQDSNVSSLGSVASAGNGNILGIRGIFTLPPKEGFFHSLSVGLDYKDFDQVVQIGLTTDTTPISYYPLSATWDGTWLHSRTEPAPTDKDPNATKKVDVGTTTLTAGVTFGLRGTGSTQTSLDRNRFGADGNFIYLRGELAHTQKLARDWELFARLQGQAADQPLVNSEQYGGGGMGTVRGYLEAEALGDNAILGTIELRTPSLLKTTRIVKVKEGDEEEEVEEKTGYEWRFYAFADGGSLTLHDTLPDQDSSFRLASVGLGTELQFREHFHGIVELAMPLTSLSATDAHELRVNFRFWADF